MKYSREFADTCSYQQSGSRKTTEAIARDLIEFPDKTLFLLNGAHLKPTNNTFLCVPRRHFYCAHHHQTDRKIAEDIKVSQHRLLVSGR